MEEITKRFLNWASILEESTRAQVQMTSEMPFIFPHVALMPDAHLGKGCAVGAVLPTLGAIMPAAVGVDIGCFVGDTRVAMLDGTQKTLARLTEMGGEHWVYSLNADGVVVPGRAVALRTRADAPLMRVTVSGGDEIVCTPDHPFMLNDGTYREAQDLRFNDSLKPLYRAWQTRDGYESVSTGKGSSHQTHVLVYEAVTGSPVPAGMVVHHDNHNHFDNRPENLVAVAAGEHSRHHRETGCSFEKHDPAFQATRIAGVRRADLDPARQAQMAGVGAHNIRAYMDGNPEHFREATVGNGLRCAPVLDRFNITPSPCGECQHEAANPAALRWHVHREHGHNHKVIGIEVRPETAEVYCLQVEEHHNFALAAGVFVHNCGMFAVRTQYVASDLPDERRPLREAIEAAVPLSAGRYNDKISRDHTLARIRTLEAAAEAARFDPATYAANWQLQLGTLGSGNHFIEVSLDEEDRVWLFLHSGSRGVGNKIAMHHIKVAQELCRKWWINLPDPDLAYLVEGTDEFWTYIRELRWAQHFALLNREEMMDRVVVCFQAWVGAEVVESERINCFAGETEVLTSAGRRPIRELAGGTHELLGADGLWVKAPVEEFGTRPLTAVTLSRSGVLKTIYATPEHGWIARTRRGLLYDTITRDLRPGDRLAFSYPERPTARTLDHSSVARGFVYGDGSTAGVTRSRANFCGTKDAVLLRYFEGHGRPPRTYPNMTVVNGLPREWKTDLPTLDSHPSVLYGWLAGYFAADGDVGKTGRPTLSSASRETLEYVRDLCSALGIGTFGVRTHRRLGYGPGASDLHLVGLMRADLGPEFFVVESHRERFVAGRYVAERRGWNVVRVEATDRVETVYCAVVEGQHAFTLADNILTRNCHHNYTAQERHFGKNVWLSRKGAIDADRGVPGLIPGSMGTRSYVVEGKGNRLALNSSPHGAGREYGRRHAQRTFTYDQLVKSMEGIEWSGSKEFIDEIPEAYKDIDVVMKDADDLVGIRHTLRQIINVKGD